MTGPADEPIEIARQINDAFAATPFETLRDVTNTASGHAEAAERLRGLGHTRLASIEDLLDDEVLVGETDIDGASTLTVGVASGKDAWWRWFRAWFEPWDDLSVEALDYEARGAGAVLADCRVRARGEISGVPTELEITQLWVVRDGKVARYGIYSSREAAVEALERAGEEP